MIERSMTMTKRKELWEAWLTDLESGEFHQTREKLFNGKKGRGAGYCCLGVLCVTSNRLGAVTAIDLDDTVYYSDILPGRLAKKLNISTIGEFKQSVQYKDRQYKSLSELNDGGHARFKTIARIIREQRAADNFSPYS